MQHVCSSIVEGDFDVGWNEHGKVHTSRIWREAIIAPIYVFTRSVVGQLVAILK